MSGPNPLLLAAKLERDRRAESYPGKISDGADAEALSIDYQCWVAIAEWLETDRFFSFAGGAEPERSDAPIIRWPDLERAAEKAVGQINDKVAKQEAKGAADELTELYLRRARLICIHRRLQLRRASIDSINRSFAERHEQQKRKAA